MLTLATIGRWIQVSKFSAFYFHAGYQASRIQELKGVIAGLSTVLILLLIVLGGTLLVYFIVRRVRRSGKYVVSDLEKKPEGEENLEIKPVKSVEDQVQKGEVNMTSKIMDATDVLNQLTNTQQNIYDVRSYVRTSCGVGGNNQ